MQLKKVNGDYKRGIGDTLNEKRKGQIKIVSCGIIFLLILLVFNQMFSLTSGGEGKIIDYKSGVSSEEMENTRSLVDSHTKAYYSFDNPNDLGNDDSKNSDFLDLTIANGASQTGNSLYGRALNLDGYNDRASIPPHSSMHLMGALTIDVNVFWRGPGTGGSYDTIIAQSQHFWLYVRRAEPLTGRICFSAGDPWGSIISDSELPQNEWTRISVVRTPTTGSKDNVKIYINGILDKDADIDDAYKATSSSTTYIGAWDYTYFHSFNGYIDEASISDTAREIGDSVGFWNFNEGAGTEARDRTQKSYAHGSLHDYNPFNGDDDTPPQWTEEGKYGKALIFDGMDDYVKIEANDKLHLVAKTTIEAWVKYDGPGGDTYGATDTILGQSGHFWLHIPRSGSKAGKVVFESGNGPWYPDVVSTKTLEKNVWIHIAIVRTSSTNVQIYINGVLDVEDSTYQPTGTSANNVFIGSWGGYKHFFKGCIDEVRISNYDKTFESDYNYGGDVLELPFEGVGNEILEDKSTHGNDMDAMFGGAQQVDDGKYKKCVSLDGVDDYLIINAPIDSSLEPSTISIEAWIYPESISEVGCIVDHSEINFEGGLQKGGYYLNLQNDGKIGFAIYSNGWTQLNSKIQVEADQWWHVCGVYDGRYLKIYINGVLGGLMQHIGSISYGTDNGFNIGRYAKNNDLQPMWYFHGKIDEVRISNFPRTFHEDTDGDGMSDMYEIMRSPFSDQYNPMEHNGRYGLLCASPNNQISNIQHVYDVCEMYKYLRSTGWNEIDIITLMPSHNSKWTSLQPELFSENIPVDGDGTRDNVQIALDGFESGGVKTFTEDNGDQNQRMIPKCVDKKDIMFMEYRGHGGGRSRKNGGLYNYGRVDEAPHEDETESYYINNPVDESLNTYSWVSGQLVKNIDTAWHDDDLKTELNQISCKYSIILIDSCFSGGFINDLSKDNRIIVTSQEEYLLSERYSCLFYGRIRGDVRTYYVRGDISTIPVQETYDQNQKGSMKETKNADGANVYYNGINQNNGNPFPRDGGKNGLISIQEASNMCRIGCQHRNINNNRWGNNMYEYDVGNKVGDKEMYF